MPNFVPAADEVYRLQTGRDTDCRHFQKIAEQGHYAGRTVPSSTRQGTYAAAPSGVLLASVNSNDPARIADMLKRALAKWQTMSREERLLPVDPQEATTDLPRGERLYPEDGLVLRVNSRDLPRDSQSQLPPTPAQLQAQAQAQAQVQDARQRGRANAWNQDFLWFRKDEARQFLPERLAVSEKREVADLLIRRIARCSLVDNVRGQTSPFDDRDVQKAVLTSEVVSVDGDIIALHLEGETQTGADGVWSIQGYRDMNSPSMQRRGFAMRLLGHARYDTKTERFTVFEMIALGTRWGATQNNGRGGDLGPAPIGIAFTLGNGMAAERVAPAYLRAYGWEVAAAP
jgi:hypothetical protein